MRFNSIVLVLFVATIAHCQDFQESEFVSDASRIVGTYVPEVDARTPETMSAAAQGFLDSLDETLREKVTYELKDPERREWTNLPARPNAGGVALGKCNEQQVKAFCQLLATLLSKQGYEKMCHIMLADDQLLRNGKARPGFGTEEFSIVIFGTPSKDQPWAFQLDGHHLGLNVSIEGSNLTIAPSFIGTQPKAVKVGNTNFQPLLRETNEAHALIEGLVEEQQKKAIIAKKRGRIQTGPGHDGEVPTPEGVSCETFDDVQRDILLSLISEWVEILPEDLAKARMKQIESELDKTTFAWRGGTSEGSDISYSIQGPSVIIEYACQDLGGDPLNHIHTMYRDPTNEYGGQLK